MTDDTTADSNHSTTNRRRFLIGGAAATGVLAVPTAGVLGANSSNTQPPREFQVRIENVSSGSTLSTTADGDASTQPVPLSPGAFAVHTGDEPIFTEGRPERGNGLEEIAEDGKPPSTLADSLATRDTVTSAGAFAVPDGADDPGPLLPGNAYEFTVEASSGRPTSYLSLVTMFVPSNDVFFALGGDDGMALFDGDAPNTGDVTNALAL